MNSNRISTKTGGINDVTGYYISSCCRSEVFLDQGVKKPRCPECGGSTEWGVTLRRVADSRPKKGHDPRIDERHAPPEGFPHLSRIEWGGFGLEDVPVVNYSQSGIAVEVPDPAIFFGKVQLTLRNGALVSGTIKHCKPKDTKYVLGIVCAVDLGTLEF